MAIRLLGEHPLVAVLRQHCSGILVDQHPQATAKVELEEAGRHDVEAEHRGHAPAVAVHVAGKPVRGHVGGGRDGLLTSHAVGFEADRQPDHVGVPGLEGEVEASPPAATVVVVFADGIEVVDVVQVELEDALAVTSGEVGLELGHLVGGLLALVFDGLEILFGRRRFAGDDGHLDRVAATVDGDEL